MIAPAPKPTPRSAIVQRVVSKPGLGNRLRARRFGLDALLGRPPVLELYYEPGDPHSHLAAQLLPRLLERLKIPIAVRIVGEPDAVVYPEQDKQRSYALTDAARIAPAWGLNFPSQAKRPSARAIENAARILLAADSVQAFCKVEEELAHTLFSGEIPHANSGALAPADAHAELTANYQRRAALGNYLPGVWQLNGNWYWSVDRLDHLAADLRAGDWLKGDEPIARFEADKAALPEWKQGSEVLEFFYSFRSPYSYLAAVESREQIDRLPVTLKVRPVLPMAMRGMKIPPYKGLYIARDVYREAAKRNIAFGRIADPLGLATERCLTLFNLLDDPRQQLDFIVSNSRAVWSEGIDVAKDDGLRYVWERAGQDWTPAAEKLAAGMDLTLAETNRQALFEAGLWGVPSFRLGDFSTWGNDRLWMLDELFQRQSDNQQQQKAS